MSARVGRALRERASDERGAVIVWMAILMVVLIAFTGWAVDYSHWNNERAHMQKAADAAALAGAVYLPDDPAGAFATARSVAAQNGYPSGVSTALAANANQLKVTINTSVKNSFAVAIGIGTTNLSRRATGEFESPQPLDIALIIDRTGSMATPVTAGKTPLDHVKDATKSVLGYLSPRNESIALGTLGPSATGTTCSGANAGAYGMYSGVDVTAPATTWMIAPYPFAKPENDYQNPDGSLKSGSQIVKTVNCLQFGSFTDLGDPVAAAASYLNTYGRPGSKRGIILMTDGAANRPIGSRPCQYAENAATAAKAAGIQVLTIGFLSNSNKCLLSDEVSGKYVGVEVTKLLAAMASPVKGVAAVDNGCVDAENTDGDNFFCEPKGGDISAVFLAAVGQLAGRLPRIVA